MISVFCIYSAEKKIWHFQDIQHEFVNHPGTGMQAAGASVKFRYFVTDHGLKALIK